MSIEAKHILLRFLAAVVLMLQAACITGCESAPRVHTETECDSTKNPQELAKFIVDCAAAANPKSDEEGEDLVAQCERTGFRTFEHAGVCHEIFFCETPHFDHTERVRCDNAPFNSDCEATCKKHGWMRK